MKGSNRTAVVVERCLTSMGRDNLLHQMQSQNMGCVGVSAGIGEIPQNRFGVASAIVPDFQHELFVRDSCQYRNVTAGGIVVDTVVQKIIHGSRQ